MKVIRILIVAAVLIAAFSQLQAQPTVETLTVDTLVNLSKTGLGEASGAYFLPDGNIIVSWKDTPLIIDSKSGEILRQLETCNSEAVFNAKVSKDGNRLVATKMGPKFLIWDVPTGKILKILENVNGYCFSPDGKKLYIIGGNSGGLGAVRVMDMNTLEEIERFGSFPSGFHLDITPDGQTLAVSFYKEPNNVSDKKTTQIILIDQNDKKNYAIVETLEPGIVSMEFSPDGKLLMYRYVQNDEPIVCIWDLTIMKKIILNPTEIGNKYNIKQLIIYDPEFLDNNTIILPVANLEDDMEYTFIWKIKENILSKLIAFSTLNKDIRNNSLLLCSNFGQLAILDYNYISVNETINQNKDYLTYRNNQLEYFSDKNIVGESIIYETTGKLISNLGSQQFVMGKNIIRINQPLPIGVYILTINDKTNQLSYKFIVE